MNCTTIYLAVLQVTRINPRLASLDILCVGDLPLDTTFTGVIRCAQRKPHPKHISTRLERAALS